MLMHNAQGLGCTEKVRSSWPALPLVLQKSAALALLLLSTSGSGTYPVIVLESKTLPTHESKTHACTGERSLPTRNMPAQESVSCMLLELEKNISLSFLCDKQNPHQSPVNLIVSWCGRFLFFVVRTRVVLAEGEN